MRQTIVSNYVRKYLPQGRQPEDHSSYPKICILAHTFLKGGGGTASLRVFLDYLGTMPVKIYLVTGPDVDKDSILGLKGIEWICLPAFRRSINLLGDLKTCLELRRVFRREKFALLHTNYAKPGVIGRVIGRLSGIKIIVHHIYGCTFNEVYSPIARLVNRHIEIILSKLTDYYIFVGRDILNRYIKAKIILNSNYSIVYPAMEFRPFVEAYKKKKEIRIKKRSEFGLEKDHFAIGLVSRFIRGKGHVHALEMIDDLRKTHPRVRTFFVGRGPLQKDILRQINQMGLENYVKILGYRDDLESLMMAWDAGIFTSFGEGLPQVLAQMVLLGLPVVTFEVDGARELLKDGETGYIVPIGDSKTMAERLRMLLNNLDDFQSRLWGKAGVVSPDWDPKKMSRKLYEVYIDLMARSDTIKA